MQCWLENFETDCPGALPLLHQVIDCGGGTVDISAFRVVNPAQSNLEQIGTAIGGPWGSTNVDKQFEAYLKVQRYFIGGVAAAHRAVLSRRTLLSMIISH